MFQNNVKEIFYLPPLYYNFYYFGDLLGFRLRPVAKVHPFENDFELSLPNKKTVLIVCDPVWYAGTVVPEWVYEHLKVWQEKTGSTIFIDGSFQYMRWDETIAEPASKLDPNLTYRLICPTKALAIHGFRFSYMLVPEQERDALRYIYANSHGPGSVHGLRFAYCAMKHLSSREGNRKLLNYIVKIFDSMCSNDMFTEVIMRNSGYFVFGKLNHEKINKSYLSMDGEFFEQSRYPDYSRVNILSPDTQSYLND
ncbi:MAG: hypothetical protein JKY92_05500 [Magnetovibrio sp.]|nr:hypothetical protein [Magnetovibrio sp.]